MAYAKKQKDGGSEGGTLISIPELKIKRVRFWINGNAPFVSHAWSQKAMKMMEEAQSGKPKQGKAKKEGRNPFEDYMDSIHYTDEDAETLFTDEAGTVHTRSGRPGIPARMFKSAAVESATDVGAFKTTMRSAFFVEGDILPIVGSAPKYRCDPVRLESGVASLAYRAEFYPWAVQLTVKYNAGVITYNHIINLFNTAGFGVGVGEGRPKSKKSCGMGWGTFTIGEPIEEIEYTSDEVKMPVDLDGGSPLAAKGARGKKSQPSALASA